MSNSILGIDLGTTNSCVAIKGSNDGCFAIDTVPGYSVVTDRLKRKFTPSVLAHTGKSDKPYEIGHNAKISVEGRFPPVMFAKRDLGTDVKYQIDGDQFITPVEVSAEILKYLKQMAETELGQKINKAVVTVPAYFNFTQSSLTKEAIKKAGFIVDDERCILQEPVAAALTYTQIVQAESLKIMVYDLGGGTFDISVVKKEGTFVEVVKFGGDNALGGYDFDKILADHFLTKLKEIGYKLDLNIEKNSEDHIRYVKLLLEAELAKISLTSVLEVHVRKPGIFKDQNGDLVDLDLLIDRPAFESMISGKIYYTMDTCKETLKKSGFSIDQIDKIIMVGGSSYIPLILKRLEEEFEKEPQFLEPDLCVAIGAAIQASQFGEIVEHDVRIKFDKIPAVSTFESEAISGKVTNLMGNEVEEGYIAEIINPISNYKENQELVEGNFYFDIHLQADVENLFLLKIVNKDGKKVAETEIKITHSSKSEIDESGDTEISGTVNLSKAIFVKRESGLHELAAEGVVLPYEKKEEFPIIKEGRIDDEDSLELEVQLFEQDLLLGEVKITDIPGTIGNNEPVIVGIKITPDYQIIVNAQLPTVNKEGKAVFSQNIEKVHSSENLQNDLDKLCADWEKMKLLLSQDELAKIGVKITRLIKRAKEYFAGNNPDRTEVSKIVSTLKLLISDLKGKGPLILSPSKEKFDMLCEETRNLIKKAEGISQHAKDMQMERSLDSFIEKGKHAYESRNQDEWKTINKQVEELSIKAYNIIRSVESNGEPDPEQLLLSLIFLINEMREEINRHQSHKMYERWINKITEIQKEAKKLGEEKDNTKLLRNLRELYQNKLEPLKEEIQGGGIKMDKVIKF